MTDPERLMREALAEASKGLGHTAPNPPVGAVVARDGRIVGRGHHARAGAPHAEPVALADAGAAAEGADLYVTLEPCCTTGRTPPCTEAIKKAGIRRVFVGCTDPYPPHAGRAYGILRAAGIEVIENVLEAECRDLVRAFAFAVTRKLPYVTLKFGASLDGRIADGDGRSRWITGPQCRERVQELRRRVDAVLVGTETLLLDNPELMPRPPEGRAPLRLVPDRRGRLPADLKVFTDASAKRTCCLLGENVPARHAEMLKAKGVQVLEAPETETGFDWGAVLHELCRRGVHHILCEGGGQLAAALLEADLVNEMYWGQAPILLGSAGRPAVDRSWSLASAPRLRRISLEVLGEDVWMRFQRIES